ncbi:MAG: HAD-IB family hydrolase [Burkholderiaceae bacterium]|nr:HAD-IB family hydrolase [Burkholderiaceae bacterium]
MGTSMRKTAAFFDVDETIINLKSMFSFQEYFFKFSTFPLGPINYPYQMFLRHFKVISEGVDRKVANREFYKSFRGRSREAVTKLANPWFNEILQKMGEDLWIQSTLDLIDQMRQSGHLLVAVTGSSQDFLSPILSRLRFDGCIGTTLEVVDGIYTGEISPPQTIGDGKATAIRSFSAARGIDLSQCFACADHISDLPMLNAVGEAAVVAGDRALEAEAQSRGWAILPRPPLIDAQSNFNA